MNAVVPKGHFSYRNRLGKRFAFEDRVVIHSLPVGDELDGATGVIVGKSSEHIATSYIVLLDKRHSRGDRAVHMVETCLDYPTIETRVDDAA